MENREQQILSEIKTMMSSIRIQLEKLDAKMAELQQVVDPEDVAAMPIDLDIDMDMMVQEVVEDDLPFVDLPDDNVCATEPEIVADPEPAPEIEPAPVIEPVPVIEPAPEVEVEVEVEVEAEPEVQPEPEPVCEVVDVEPEPEAEPEPIPVVVPEPEPVQVIEAEDDDLPLFSEPTTIFEAAINSPKTKKAVIDVMTDTQAWRTDMVGAPVRDLLSAISLNDRVLFINTLFNEDPVLFQQTRAKINMMTSLDEVVEYVTSHFDWDLSSQVVYRFMMAVRRKVQA